MTAVAERAVVGLKFLNELAVSSGSPHARIVAGLAVSIITSIAAVQQNSQTLGDLSGRVLDIANLCGKILTEHGLKDGTLWSHTDTLISSLRQLERTIVKMQSRKAFTKWLSSSVDSKTLRALTSEVEGAAAALEIYVQFSNLSLSNPESSSRAKNDLLEAIDARMTSNREEQIEVIKQQQREKTLWTMQESVPPAPPIFNGREAESAHLSDILAQSQPVYIAILGPGGIGKTSLAAHAMHMTLVAKKFGSRRLYLACDGLSSSQALYTGIAQLFGIEDDRKIGYLKRFITNLEKPVLLTLDNLETPWEPSGNREEVETLLGKLTEIPNLSLMVTLRGAERPSGVPWTRPFLPPLSTLSTEAALKTFLDLSDAAGDQDHILLLLQALENMPLAVTLVASQAQYTPVSDLLGQWSTNKTSMLKRGGTGRLSSIELSIEVSLQSERFVSSPSSMKLLQVLSVLPNGASLEELANMTPPELDVAHAVLPLLQVSLSYRDHFQRIRVLSPIREYVNTRYQLSIELFNPLLAYHAKIAEFCSETYNTDARQQMFDRVTPQLENLQSVFDQGLKVPRLADETSQVVLSFSRYFAENWEDRVLPLVERSLSQARAAGNRKLEGQLLHWRGAHKSDPEQLKEALAIFQHLGYRLGQIEVLTSLSRNLVAYAKLSEAESSIDQAYELIDKDTPVRQIIRVHITRATLQHSRGRFVESVRAARKSLTLDPHASVHSRSTLHNVLADCYLYLGYHRQAAYHSRVGIAYSLSADGIPSQRYDSLGDCLLTMSRVSEARAAYFKAYEGFVSINATNWAAAVLRNSARTFVHQGRYTEALQQFQLSLATFDFGLHAGDTKVAYGDLYLRMGDHATAWRYYADARANFLRPECIEVWNKHLWMAVMHMGDIKLEEGCLDEARNFFVVALAQCKKYRIKLGVAQCIQRLGDLQWKTDDLLLPDAESCYIVTREILEALDANRHMADVVLRIALVKLWRGEVEASSDALQQAMKLYELAEDEQGKGFVQKVIEDCRAKQPDEIRAAFPNIPLGTQIKP